MNDCFLQNRVSAARVEDGQDFFAGTWRNTTFLKLYLVFKRNLDLKQKSFMLSLPFCNAF